MPPSSPPRSFTETRLARKRHRQEARRGAILEAARQLLAESGIECFSVERTAELARLSKPSVYYYFKSKEALVLGLAADALEAETTVLERIVPSSSAERVLGSVVAAFIEHYIAHPDFFKTLYFWSEVAGVARGLVEVSVYPRAVAVREKLARMLEAEVSLDGPSARHRCEAVVALALAAARGITGDAFSRTFAPREVRALGDDLVRALYADLARE
jgi:AcrR family transcriptional regulator